MIKNLKAAALGYFVFRVNGERFFTYSGGLAARKATPPHMDVLFTGWNLWAWVSRNPYGAWRSFYERRVAQEAGKP